MTTTTEYKCPGCDEEMEPESVADSELDIVDYLMNDIEITVN